jgi:hypothetical protein
MKLATILLWAVALVAGEKGHGSGHGHDAGGVDTPEPGTWVMVLGGLGVAAWKHRRYKKAK